MQTPGPELLLDGILSGNRAALARGITLIESTRREDRNSASRLVTECLRHSGNAIRIGITGPPGVGKSTFVEVLGMRLVDRDERTIAVLAVDPSSAVSGGSILGDKTRMRGLAAAPGTFIRPSPSAGTPGGIARRTREAIVLVEAAGFDTVFVETVGVGQSETAVHTMVDFFLLLAPSGAGDELQGIKRGVVELADAIAITKSDGENTSAAQRARVQYKSALQLFPPTPSGWKPRVHTCSAETGKGLDRVWDTICEYERVTRDSGYFSDHRRDQARHWFYETLDQRLRERIFIDDSVRESLTVLENDVVDGRKSASEAVETALELWRQD